MSAPTPAMARLRMVQRLCQCLTAQELRDIMASKNHGEASVTALYTSRKKMVGWLAVNAPLAVARRVEEHCRELREQHDLHLRSVLPPFGIMGGPL